MGRMWTDFYRGILPENPIIRLVLGLCPALAVTTTAVNGIGMGLATLIVLLGSNILVSILRNSIPDNVRIPAFIVIIASFVTLVDFTMAAYTPGLHEALGIFIPLIVVNCIVMGRAEAFARKNPTRYAIADALGMGLGFTWALFIIAAVREMFGNGTLFGAQIFGAGYEPATMLILPPGGFIVLGVMIAILNVLERRSKERVRSERAAQLEMAALQARGMATASGSPQGEGATP